MFSCSLRRDFKSLFKVHYQARSFPTVVLWSIRSSYGEGVCYQVVFSRRVIKETSADTKAIQITQWAPLTSPVSPESMLQAPNPQWALSTRVKRSQRMSGSLPQSLHSHQAETECLLRVTTCFISPRASGRPASEELSVSARGPLIRNSQPCKPWEPQGKPGHPPCDLQQPRGPTWKVTRWLKPWSLSLIYAGVITFFSLKKYACVWACVCRIHCPSPESVSS